MLQTLKIPCPQTPRLDINAEPRLVQRLDSELNGAGDMLVDYDISTIIIPQ